MEEANKLIGAGKKHLVMGQVVEAVGALQEACSMLAKTYGDTADECGEAFFWCGRALLELARMENSVLGNALEGVPEEEEEEEEKPKDSNCESTENIDEKTRDELRVQVYDAMAEKKPDDAEKVEGKQSEDAQVKSEACDQQEKAAASEEEEKTSTDDKNTSAENNDNKENEGDKEPADKPEDAEDGEEEAEEEDGDDAEIEEGAQEQGEGDGAAEKDNDDDEEDGEGEEVGNLQLAWEMLEVAKAIYKRKETKEDQLMAAQIHLKLGEVSAESGNYSMALEDYRECLKLQVKHLDSDSRLLAETHYQLGLTYSLNLEYSRAVEELNSSISVIKSRLDKLQELTQKAEGPEALPEERKEMEELKALLPEIQEKVEDATEGMKIASTASEAVKGVLGGGTTSSGFPETTVHNGDASSSSKVNGTSVNGVGSTNGHTTASPVSDISHLVRKKRKPEESPVKEGVVKKVKQEDDHTNQSDKGSAETDDHSNTMEVQSQ